VTAQPAQMEAPHSPRRPRGRLAGAAATAWGLPFGVLRDFVWADLRDDTIDVRGLPVATSSLIWFAAIVLAVMIVALLFGDVWRGRWPLIPTPNGTPGRGSLVPVALLPATILLFAVAWCLILVGSLFAGLKTRLAVLGFFLLTLADWTDPPSSTEWADLAATPSLWVAVGTMAAVGTMVARPRWARRNAALAFVALLLLAAAQLVPAQARSLEDWRVLTGIPLMMARIEDDVTSLRLLIMPLLLLIGIDVAIFIRQVAGWTTDVVAERFPPWAPFAVLAPLLAWRTYDVWLDGAERVDEIALAPALLAYAGAALAPLGIGLSWWLVERLARGRAVASTGAAVPIAGSIADAPADAPDLIDVLEDEVTEMLPDLTLTELGGPDPEAVEAPRGPPTAADIGEAAESWALLLVVAYTGFGLVSYLSGSIAGALGSFGFIGAAAPFVVFGGMVNLVATPRFLLVDAAALAIGLRLARRGSTPLAVYLVSFAVLRIWWEATRPGRPLGMLDSLGWETVDAWWAAIGVALAAWWLARGRLTRERALALIFLLLVGAVVRQTDFIENKFTPLFGWAGVGFIAFGLAWDALTKGAWANRGTPALPKPARILLYLGYALLTVTVVNWSLATHDMFDLRLLTGGGALLGFAAFGRPMLYAVLVATLVAASRARPAVIGANEADAAARRAQTTRTR